MMMTGKSGEGFIFVCVEMAVMVGSFYSDEAELMGKCSEYRF